MKFLEKPLLNTHYYLQPGAHVTYSRVPFQTITPTLIQRLLFEDHTLYYTPQKEWLIHLTHEEEDVLGRDMFKKAATFVQLPEREFLLYNNTDWFTRNWNKPFIVSNPVYMYEDRLYVFSNREAKAVALDGHLPLMEQILEVGGFAIGNGVIVGLCLVALGLWTERVFLQELDNLDQRNHLYHTFPNHWSGYLFVNPCHPADHLCKYAFIFNSERIFKHLYYITREDMFLYHIPQRHITSITSFANKPYQIAFAKCFKNYYLPGVFHPRPDLYHHLLMHDFSLIAHIIDVSQINFTNVLFILADLYKKKPKYKRHLKNLWRYLMHIFQDDWQDYVYEYFVDQIIAHDKNGQRYPCLPRKLLRDTTYRTQFQYDASWNILFKYIDRIFHTAYNRSFDRTKIHRLKILKAMTTNHMDGHIVESIMKDFYRENPEELTVARTRSCRV